MKAFLPALSLLSVFLGSTANASSQPLASCNAPGLEVAVETLGPEEDHAFRIRASAPEGSSLIYLADNRGEPARRQLAEGIIALKPESDVIGGIVTQSALFTLNPSTGEGRLAYEGKVAILDCRLTGK